MNETQHIVLLGASGDLTRRKLIPALVSLHAKGALENVHILGVSRSKRSDEVFREGLREVLKDTLHDAFDSLAPRICYHATDITTEEGAASLSVRLQELPGGNTAGRLYYFSTGPRLFAPATKLFYENGLLSDGGGYRRAVYEKPFGYDRDTAHALNEELHKYLREDQIFRIDHYLGKEIVQNIIGFRFHNSIFEPLWNRHHVELVQITASEPIGMEGRGDFYDDTGAMRDVMRNHMLQMLALVAMDAPASLDPEDVRGQKVRLLRALHVPDDEDVRRHSVRAQYTGSGDMPGYLEEEGVGAESATETYVALRASIDNWRWAGVPFLLRHGKRMPAKHTVIQVQFRRAPLQLFNKPEGITDAELRRKLEDGSLCHLRPNVLTLSLQPSESIRLSFGVKRPGQQMTMSPAHLDFDYADHFGQPNPPAYEPLFADALAGDPTLFLRADEIEASWHFADAWLEGWGRGVSPVRTYDAGSWGPAEADALWNGCEGGWFRG